MRPSTKAGVISTTHHPSQEPATYNSYVSETLTRQRLQKTARQARPAHQRVQIKTPAGWHFHKVSFRGRRTSTVRPD